MATVFSVPTIVANTGSVFVHSGVLSAADAIADRRTITAFTTTLGIACVSLACATVVAREEWFTLACSVHVTLGALDTANAVVS